jgi:1-aminocyclopropane-1-carboxylate deaminase
LIYLYGVLLPTFRDVSVDLTPWGLPHTSLFVRMYAANNIAITGNKAFKLWPYLISCSPGETVLSWGGAFSNHLLALSAAAATLGLKSIGIVRGDEQGLDNAWLRAMKKNGMHLHFVSRNAYQNRNDSEYSLALANSLGASKVIPEGGKGLLGIQGASEMVGCNEPYDLIALCGGTGTTAAGIARKLLPKNKKVICLQALKGKGIIWDELQQSSGLTQEELQNLTVFDELNFGRFGQIHREAEAFGDQFFRHTGIELDKVYGKKGLLGLIQLMRNGDVSSDKSMLYIHTGGLEPN